MGLAFTATENARIGPAVLQRLDKNFYPILLMGQQLGIIKVYHHSYNCHNFYTTAYSHDNRKKA